MKKLFTNLIALIALALIPTAKANAFKVYVTGQFIRNIDKANRSLCAYIYDDNHQEANAYNGSWDESTLSSSNTKTVDGITYRYVEVNSTSPVKIILHYQGQRDNGKQSAEITASSDIYLNYEGGDIYTNVTNMTAWEIVASGNPNDWSNASVHALTASRVRESGGVAGALFTVGLKAEQLPFNNGKVYWYIRNKNNHNIAFYPSSSNTWVSDMNNITISYSNLVNYSYVANCMHQDETAMTPSAANTFVINRAADGDDANNIVSYTFAINTSERPYDRSSNNNGGSHTFTRNIKAQSVGLYKNQSISSLYANMYKGSGSAFNTNVTYKGDEETYYLIGQLDGSHYDYNAQTSNNMTRSVYLNPTDASKVDSVVYNITVQKGAGGFNSLYLSFMPQSLWDDERSSNSQMTFNISGDKVGTTNNAWNYIVRPQVQDTYDALASYGSLFVCGTNSNELQNSNQALNPIVDDSYNYEYYIVHLNVTTSTYNIEFIQGADPINIKYIRTYCTKAPLDISNTALKAYAVQKVDFNTSNGSTTDKKGTVYLRRLNYIPADQGVVLVYEGAKKGTIEETQAQAVHTVDGILIKTSNLVNKNEDLWYYKDAYPNYSNETYNNFLQPIFTERDINEGTREILDGEKKYVTRNFALNTYYATDGYDSSKENYYGFFRFARNSHMQGESAYMELPRRILENNALYAGPSLDDDGAMRSAKVGLVFDDFNNTTGINNITTEDNVKKNDGVWYNLQGMQVSKPNKGVYIHNGHKVIIK